MSSQGSLDLKSAIAWAQKEFGMPANAAEVFVRRYVRKGEDGGPAETPSQTFERVAAAIADPEKKYGKDPGKFRKAFYRLLANFLFVPNSPTWTGAGTPLGQLAACFVLPIKDDLGRDPAGIFSTLRVAALIQQTGGGNGFSFSDLRPRGDFVKRSGGRSTGPVGFLRAYDSSFDVIAQGGVRRGANMAVLKISHPDVRSFVHCKEKEGELSNFNISVGATDDFMQAVEKGENFKLVNPRDGKVSQEIDARELFAEIIASAHHNGEPGILFLDRANRDNPVPHLYELQATNPCVTGDTLVATPDGWLRVDSIKEGDEINTVLGVGKVETVETHENVPVFNIYLSDGGIVKATAAHQFHVRGSRQKFFEQKSLDEIKVGEWVRVFHSTVPENTPPSSGVDLDDREYGFLVGVLVGDGCYTPHRLSKNVVRITSHADALEWNKILEDSFVKVGAEKMYTYVNEGSRSMMMDPKPGRVIADWVRSLPLQPAISPDKTLPEVYINSNREFLIGLLDGLFSTDGSVDLQSNHPLLRFHTASVELARQLRRILLMFGIHGRICKTIRKRHAIAGRFIRSDRPKYDVVVSGSSFGRFYEQVRLSHPEKQKRMEEAALRSNFTGGNWAARVVRIEPAGFERVYDLHEPRSDTWITEGYVSRGCGEQWLGPYENCCLGSINLARHLITPKAGQGSRAKREVLTPRGKVDWEKLAATIRLSTFFLDNVVDANAYVPEVPELEKAALAVRRIGLGIMGLADLMYALGVSYGEEDGLELAAQVMEFVRFHSMLASIERAEDRGPFLAIKGSIYDPKKMVWQPPTPLYAYKKDFGRPQINWSRVVAGIKKHGIRNGAQTTIAPTGTISTVAGVEGYGCEPVFALSYVRRLFQAAGEEGVKRELSYTSPAFEAVLKKSGLDIHEREDVYKEVRKTGTVQGIKKVSEKVRRVFVVSQDITPKQHIQMQAVLQRFVDNSISKTCNFPSTATVTDVKEAYLEAWRLGCKGLTVYVTGTRKEVVLETEETKQKREAEFAVKPRPSRTVGSTYRIDTPVGSAFITVNENGDRNPLEVFINVGKAGSDIAADAEAIGRLSSLVLRIDPTMKPKERLAAIIDQLSGIGGSRTVGFGAGRVRSLADGVARILREYLGWKKEEAKIAEVQPQLPVEKLEKLEKVGDICPTCGQATLVNEEGCRKCYSCGYSEC